MTKFETKTFELKNGSVILIREAEPSDAKELITFVNTVGSESDYLALGANEFTLTEEQEKEFLQTCQSSENNIYLVAMLDNKIVGTLHFGAGNRARVRHSGELGMSVLQRYWGQGIGALLLESLISWAKGTNIIKKINLRVRSDNERAVQLYKRKGFALEGTLSNELFINGRYYDLYAMGLNL
jgi:RimJ/RimL family protein N-acetyltransferase